MNINFVHLAYLFVTIPMLRKRLGGWPHGADHDDAPGRSHFSLGRAGIVINAIAVVWGLAMAINMAWPRASVYDPAGGNWFFQWFAPLFLIGIVLVGAVAYSFRTARRGVIQLPEQAAEVTVNA